MDCSKTGGSILLVERSTAWERVRDYLELTKPRIGVLVLVAVIAGAFYSSRGLPDPWRLLNVVFGTALVAAGANTLNQWLERRLDAKMRRTASRPLPADRIRVGEAVWFGGVLAFLGVVYLAAFVNVVCALVALLSLSSYVWLYTPLKQVTPLNTVVGAVPGALPIVIGSAAVTGAILPEAWALFLLIFLWQFPHFLAIAWLYREEYAGAGFRMLPTTERGRRLTGGCATVTSLALVPIGLLPTVLGGAGDVYLYGSIVLGAFLFAYSAAFQFQRTDESARRLLASSLVYLPAVLCLLMVDLV